MKTLKSDIFYAMNEINDKYILEAAQCLEQKKESDISSQKKIKLFNESNAHSRKWLARVVTVMAVSIILFTTGGIANAATGGKLVQWINGLFFGIAKPSTSDEITTSYLRGTFSIDYSDLNAVVGDLHVTFLCQFYDRWPYLFYQFQIFLYIFGLVPSDKCRDHAHT